MRNFVIFLLLVVGLASLFFPPPVRLSLTQAELENLKRKADEADRTKDRLRKMKTGFLKALKPIEEKDPALAVEVLKNFQTVEGMENDGELKDSIISLHEKIAARKPLEIVASEALKPLEKLVVGPGGFSSIQEAVEKAPDGATIRILPGTYPCSLDLTRPIVLEGDGNRDEIVLQSSKDSVLKLSGKACVTNVTIAFTGFSQTDAVKITGGTPTLKRCSISSTASAKGPQWVACVAIDEGSPMVLDNRIAGSKGMGISIKGGSPKVSANAIAGSQIYGIWCTEKAGGIIEKNIITESHFSGIGVKGHALPQLFRNKVTNNGQNGIYVYERGGGRLSENQVTGNAWYGLEVAASENLEIMPDNNWAGNSKGDVKRK